MERSIERSKRTERIKIYRSISSFQYLYSSLRFWCNVDTSNSMKELIQLREKFSVTSKCGRIITEIFEKRIRYRKLGRIVFRRINIFHPRLLSILKYRKLYFSLKERDGKRAPPPPSPGLFIPHRANIFYTVRSFLHPFAVYLATTFYLRPVRVPLPRYSSEVKAEHRFLHSWRDKSSVFLSPPCLQRGVKAKATQNTVLSFLP